MVVTFDPKDFMYNTPLKNKMDTIVFGHLTWEVMTYVAQVADSHSSLYKDALLILAALTLLIPCEPCRRFYLSCWCIHPPPSSHLDPQSTKSSKQTIKQSNETLMDWVYDIHAIVNVKIRVTKSHLVKPEVCLAPALSRQELQRRYACLLPGSAISLQGFLDFILITAHGAKRHAKDHRRAQAWKVMIGSLAAILTKDPYAKPLSRALTKVMKTTQSTPWSCVLHISDAFHKELGLKPLAPSSLLKRMDSACGPLGEWLDKTFCGNFTKSIQ